MVKILSLLFLLSLKLFGGVVENGLNKISIHDKACMSAFFDDAIKMDQIAHVLYFETKPISLIAKILRNKQFNDTLCLKGWQAFKKHEHLFPHPRFIFNENIVYFNENFKVLHIYLINKKTLSSCLSEYINFFKEKLGSTFSKEWFIANLENGCALEDLIQKDEMLLGILLGFGDESSKAFQEKSASTLNASPYSSVDLKVPRGCRIQPIVFMGNPNSEQVKKLTCAYEKELEEIFDIYQKKDPLKMVLEKLCEK